MSEKTGRLTPPSDGPPEDLLAERDAFIQQFFRKGAQLTEELVKENERLRERAALLEDENLRLRAHVASDDAIRELVKKIESLEQEKRDLLRKSASAEAQGATYSSLYTDVENELANLANLYIALTQLHGARSVRGVVRNLKELLSQLVGASAFAIYLASDSGDELVAIGSEGIPAAEVARTSAKEGPVAAAFLSGEPRITPAGKDPRKGSPADPAALIPVLLDGRPVGVIAIFSTLSQKSAFVHVDVQLFKMLGAHTALALAAAHFAARSGRQMPGAQALLDLED